MQALFSYSISCHCRQLCRELCRQRLRQSSRQRTANPTPGPAYSNTCPFPLGSGTLPRMAEIDQESATNDRAAAFIDRWSDSGAAERANYQLFIFGTLLERALDPVERHKLSAHYTPRAYVERLVLPTIIEPVRNFECLQNDWKLDSK